VSNGLDAIGADGGILFLRSSVVRNWLRDEKGIVITVADSGGGRDAAMLAKLFLPFFTMKGSPGPVLASG
jgi:C4-dicarboxylate-specific signal transduction histidine kinase